MDSGDCGPWILHGVWLVPHWDSHVTALRVSCKAPQLMVERFLSMVAKSSWKRPEARAQQWMSPETSKTGKVVEPRRESPTLPPQCVWFVPTWDGHATLPQFLCALWRRAVGLEGGQSQGRPDSTPCVVCGPDVQKPKGNLDHSPVK